MKLLYEGHASFRLVFDSGAVAYIDPFVVLDHSLPADLILITHEHFDHNQVQLVEQAPGCRVIRPSDALVSGDYRSFEIGEVSVRAVPACNDNHPVDECVGYLVDAEGKLLYFAGDTSRVPFMADGLSPLGIDYAFLPCDGVYNMDLDEAILCALDIKAAHSVPIHTCPVSGPQDVAFDREKAQAFDVPGAMVVEPGQIVDI